MTWGFFMPSFWYHLFLLKPHTMRKLLFTALCLSFVQFSKAQIGVGYLHSDVLSALAINTNLEKRFWGEFRLGLDVASFNPQLNVNYNIKREQYFDMYTGLGLGIRFDASFTVSPSFGFIVKPIKDLPQFGINAEASVALSELDTYTMGAIGIRWILLKKDN